MIDFQSTHMTTGLSEDVSEDVPEDVLSRAIRSRAVLSATVAFVDCDSMATSHVSCGWTLPAKGKSSQETSHTASHKTSEGDSNTLDDLKVQGTKSEVTSAINA